MLRWNNHTASPLLPALLWGCHWHKNKLLFLVMKGWWLSWTVCEQLLYNSSRQRMCFRGFRRGNKAEVWNDRCEFSKWSSSVTLTVHEGFHFLVFGFLQAPVVLSRDHHDVSGTDSPYRETSNIYDGSAFCAGQQSSWGLSVRANKEIALKEKLGFFNATF